MFGLVPLRPLVTCLCPTMSGREDFLERALECFWSQDYPNKEFLVIGDGYWKRYLGISVFSSHEQIPDLLGKKRNFGVSRAFGEIICHFDDDDFSSPGRISDQVEHLRAHPEISVTGYNKILYHERRRVWVHGPEGRHFNSGWWKWDGTRGFSAQRMDVAGTSLCFRKSWAAEHPFISVNCGEDDAFYLEAHRSGRADFRDGSEFICATNHSGNSAGRLICGEEWEELSGPPAWLRMEKGGVACKA
jgi:hypothetical protein